MMETIQIVGAVLVGQIILLSALGFGAALAQATSGIDLKTNRRSKDAWTWPTKIETSGSLPDYANIDQCIKALSNIPDLELRYQVTFAYALAATNKSFSTKTLEGDPWRTIADHFLGILFYIECEMVISEREAEEVANAMAESRAASMHLLSLV